MKATEKPLFIKGHCPPPLYDTNKGGERIQAVIVQMQIITPSAKLKKKVSIKSFIFSFKVCTFLNDKYPNLSPRSFRLSK